MLLRCFRSYRLLLADDPGTKKPSGWRVVAHDDARRRMRLRDKYEGGALVQARLRLLLFVNGEYATIVHCVKK